jgi:chemotaxis protein MotB
VPPPACRIGRIGGQAARNEGLEKDMALSFRRAAPVVPLLATVLLAGCVSAGKYDALQTQYQDLQQQNTTLSAQVASDKAALTRLQGAVKYTVNSDLLFASGGWEMSARGKQLIANLAKKLAPTQSNKLVVNGYTDNAPIGPALAKEGVTSNLILSQKRAEAVMQFIVSQGVAADLISAVGHGDANPVAPNTTAAGKAKNRRVEITLAAPAG